MHRSGADAECFGRFEDTRAGHQFHPNTLDDIFRHRTTPEAFPWLLARARPDLTRSMIIARSNSAKTPKI